MSDPFDFDTRPDDYAVMGNPIHHSKSPQIHSAFAKQTNQRINYQALLVDIGGFAQSVGNFQGAGGKGVNITVPFKLDAFRVVDELSERAKLAGAVNTIIFEKDGRMRGDNTDGFGLVTDIIDNQGWQIAGKRVLMLGAGGAARGVLGPLLEQKPAKLFIANRTQDKAVELAEAFKQLGPIDGGGLKALEGQQFDLVINATAASLQGELPPLPDDLLSREARCYDMMYAKEPTPFMQWAQAHGAVAVSDGLGMLVSQAAESFRLWRGVMPQIKPVIQSMRDSM